MLNNLKIGQRLGAAFALMILLVCAVGGVGIYEAARINDGADELGNNWLPSIKLLGSIQTSANVGRRAALNYVLEITPEGRSAQMARSQKVVKEELPLLLQSYGKVVSSPEEQKLYEEIKTNLAAWSVLNDKVMSLANDGESGLAQARLLAVGDCGKAFSAVEKSIGDDIDLNEKGANVETQRAAETYRSALIASVALIAVAIASASFLAWTIVRSITQPVAQALKVAKAVAAGDLTSEVVVKGNDEIGQLLGSLAEMNRSLARIVGQVRASSDSIATGSAQIATGNADLSQRTEEQASNLQQTAASMEQLTGTVKNTAESASQANQLASSASAAAAKGGEVVGSVVTTMQDIASSSKKIADIISVIDGIAFQTNILALNAAVEAARAGEQGRGFAVVASEVRSLASRSAEAAKEIKSLIGASVEKVEAGSRQVNDAGASMIAIVSEVQRVSQLISEISNASGEQTTGIAQIGDAVSQLDQVTQQNAALVEESAAAAESLKQQAANLAEVVSIFKLASHQGLSNTYVTPASRNSKAVVHRSPSIAKSIVRPTKAKAVVTGSTSDSTATQRQASTLDTSKSDSWETF
jgi:methyl-accepting chemotaxis protein